MHTTTQEETTTKPRRMRARLAALVGVLAVALGGAVNALNVEQAYAAGATKAEGTSASDYAKYLSIAEVTIDPSAIGGQAPALSGSGFTNYGSYGVAYTGSYTDGSTVAIPGSFSYTYPGAATLPDGTSADVVMTYSDMNITMGKNDSSTIGNPVITGNNGGGGGPNPLGSNSSGSNGGSYAYNLSAKVTISVSGAGSDDTYILAGYGINATQSTNTGTFNALKNIDPNHARESVSSDGPTIYAPGNSPMLVSGDTFLGNGGSRNADTTYETGYATDGAADGSSGIRFGILGGRAQTFNITITPGALSHTHTSSSGEHGAIATTKGTDAATANADGELTDSKVLPGGTTAQPLTYSVPDYKEVLYTMTPDTGYKADELTIDGATVDLSVLKKGEILAFGNYVIERRGNGRYVLTMPSGTNNTNHTINVTWTTDTADILIKKNWNDGNNALGTRPSTMPNIELTASDGNTYTPVAVPDADGTNNVVNAGEDYTWADLPVYEYDGNGDATGPITYTITENSDPASPDYASAVYNPGEANTGFDLTDSNVYGGVINDPYEATVTNTALKDVEITKAWDDLSDKYANRPGAGNVTGNFTLDGGDVSGAAPTAITDNGDDTFTIKWEKVPAYDGDGNEISYQATESTVPSGYEIDGASTVGEDGTITNKLATEDLTITKAWNDNGVTGGRSALTEANFTVYADGTALAERDYTDFTVTNDPSDTNKQTVTWTNLPSYRNGQKVTYTASESTAPANYTANPAGEVASGDTITNTLSKDYVVKKVWDDNDNAQLNRLSEDEAKAIFGLSGGSITNQAPDEVTASGNEYTITWKSLPAFDANGNAITYTASETAVPDGYEVVGSSSAVAVEAGQNPNTITNKSTTIDITLTKTWDDSSSQNANPAGANQYARSAVNIDLTGTAGSATAHSSTVMLNDGDSATTVSGNTWSKTVTGLPEYYNKALVDYTATEQVPQGFDSSGVAIDAAAGTGAVTNTPVIHEKTNPLDLTIKKTDAVTGNGLAGAVFTVTKQGESSGTATSATDDSGLTVFTFTEDGTYTITETTAPTGYETNTTVFTVKVDKQLQSITLEGADSAHSNGFFQWLNRLFFGSDTGDMPGEYDAQSNTLTVPDDPTTADVTITKVWNDDSDIDGMRPGNIVVEFEGVVGQAENQRVMLRGSGDEWSTTLTGLPTYRDGQPITYTVTENINDVNAVVTSPNKYSLTYDVQSATLDPETDEPTELKMTNWRNPERVHIEGTKTWIGGEESEHVNGTVELNADGTEIISADDNLGLVLHRTSTKDNSTGVVAKDDAGRDLAIVWVKQSTVDIRTDDIDHYENDEGTISISFEEYVANPDNYDGFHAIFKHETVTSYEKQESGNGTYTVKAIDSNGNYVDPILNAMDSEGYANIFSISEATVPDNYTAATNGMDVTNTSVAKGAITVTKEWRDANNAAGLRPESVTFHLYKEDGTSAGVKALTIEGDGSATWDDLPVYDLEGTTITYKVVEEAVPGYSTEYSRAQTIQLDGDSDADPQEITVTNSLVPETTKVQVEKVWAGDEGYEESRPNVTIELYEYVWDAPAKAYVKNGTAVATLTLDGEADSEATGTTIKAQETAAWSGEFTGLPATKNGNAVIYTVGEDVSGSAFAAPNAKGTYSNEPCISGNQVDGFSVRNVYTPNTLPFIVTKVWNDDEMFGVDGYERPESVTIHVTGTDARGTVLYERDVVLTEADSEGEMIWSTETTLPASINGTQVQYSGYELDVPGYSHEVNMEHALTPYVSVTAVNTPQITTTTGTATFTVRKVDAVTGEALEGAEFTLADPYGNEWVKETGADGTVTFTIDTEGGWTLVETGVPEDYKLGDTYQWEIVAELDGDHATIEKVSEEGGSAWNRFVGLIFGRTPDGYDSATGTLTVENQPVDTKKISYVDPENEDAAKHTVLERTITRDSDEPAQPADPTRTGHTFMGWDRTIDSATGDVTYTATWEAIPDPEQKTITYVDPKADEGEQTVLSETVLKDANEPEQPADPSHEGWRFLGWDRTQDADGNVTYTATWESIPEPEQITVTYDPANGEDPSATVIERGQNEPNQPADPSRSGFRFMGWNRTMDSDGNVTYTATWEEIPAAEQITVTYNPANGEDTSSTVIARGDDEPAQPANPTREGYTFGGWLRSVDSDGNVTYTANWLENPADPVIEQITVTYTDPQADPEAQTVLSQRINRGDNEPAQPADPSHEGQRFTGWQRAQDEAGNVTYTARFEAIEQPGEYTVTYNAANGTEPMVTAVVRGDNEPAQPANPTREGYTFGGWLRSMDSDGNVTYTANWIANPETPEPQPDPEPEMITVSYDRADGSEVSVTTITRGDNEPEQPQSLAREGYTFGGWLRTQDGDGNVTYTANWIANPEIPEVENITVTYVDSSAPEGEQILATATIVRGANEPAQPANPTREGYTFGGWMRTQDAETGDVTYTANWIENPAECPAPEPEPGPTENPSPTVEPTVEPSPDPTTTEPAPDPTTEPAPEPSQSPSTAAADAHASDEPSEPSPTLSPTQPAPAPTAVAPAATSSAPAATRPLSNTGAAVGVLALAVLALLGAGGALVGARRREEDAGYSR